MKFIHSIKTAVIGLKTHKSRSTLTILGIVIGITSIILVMSLGQGTKKLILTQFESMGAKVMEVVPGREPRGFSDILQMFGDSLKQKDLLALQKKENVPHAQIISPLVFGGATAVFQNEAYRMNIYGADEHFLGMYSVKLASGRNVEEDDVKNRSDVVVLGSKVKDELFGSFNPIGQKIKIKNRNFEVVGVLTNQGSMFGWDDIALVPWTTAQQYVLGIKYFQHIIIEADSENTVDQTVEDIKITIRNSHNITDPKKDDFSINTQAQAINQVGIVINALTMFLTAVATISLIVGGVGIMNIMLVAVTERTKEIGLRKAIGATNKDILLQFLLEAVMLTSIGGIIGIILGASISYIISIILTSTLNIEWRFIFPWDAAIIGIIVASLVGLIFGIYPAHVASKKSPIEALRYE